MRCDYSHAPRLLREMIRGRRGCTMGSRCWSVSRVVTGQLVVGSPSKVPSSDLRRVPNKIVRVRYAKRSRLISPHTQKNSPHSRAATFGPLSLKSTGDDHVATRDFAPTKPVDIEEVSRHQFMCNEWPDIAEEAGPDTLAEFQPEALSVVLTVTDPTSGPDPDRARKWSWRSA